MIYSLQNYTTYSIKSGVGQISEWVYEASNLGYKSLGICDKQTMAGVIEFQRECERYGINPIIGEEFLITDDIENRDNSKKENVKGVVLLYARNDTGLKNLITLNNISTDRSKGFYYYPRLDLNQVGKHCGGLICVVPVENGYGRETEMGMSSLKSSKEIEELSDIFGEHFYIGLNPMSNELDIRRKNQAVLEKFGNSYHYIYTFNAHYPREDMSHLYEVVRGLDRISSGQLENFNRDVDNAHLPTLDEVLSNIDENHKYLKSVHDSCLSNLEKVATSCVARVELGVDKMPVVETETGSTRGDILKQVGEGFKKKLFPELGIGTLEDLSEFDEFIPELMKAYPFEHVNKGEVIGGEPRDEYKPFLKTLDKYVERLKYEFEIIDELNFFDYFHVISDICRHVDSLGLGRGIARGSAGGSLVSYLLNITRVDPLRHDLLFDRFLNRDRSGLPDIDLDFSVEAREEVKKYVRVKWGENKVCNVGTYGRLRIPSAIRNIAKFHGYSIPDNNGNLTQYSNGKLISLMKGTEAPASYRGVRELEERAASSEEFAEFCERHSNWIYKYVIPLQDTVVHKQVHAAGTLITRYPLNVSVPVYEHSSGEKVSQWQDRDCERAGNPKFDFLTVEGVNVIEFATRLIEQRHGKRPPEIEEIPLDDEKTMDIFTRGDTEGIFQFHSYSQQRYLPELKPTRFSHIVAANALIRPGPMGADAHKLFVDIVNGKADPKYDHEDLKNDLSETYGLLVYQEQMMAIARTLSDFTGPEADHLRSATGKKKLDEMAKWETPFKERGVANGYSEDLMDLLWEKIVAFAEYSFNKSHSVSYTLMSYYQAYIKARYPLEYWCAVLKYSNASADSDSSAQNLKDKVESSGIEIIYPNVFGFAADFEPVEHKTAIYWPLRGVKGVGETALKDITKGGRNSFSSLEDFIHNTTPRIINKRVVNSLIKAGFFNPIDKPWEVAKTYYEIRKERGRKDDGIPIDLRHRNELIWQMEQNNAYQMIVKPWKKVEGFHPNVQTYDGDKLASVANGDRVFIGGMVDSYYMGVTRYGDYYLRMTIIDKGEKIPVICWGGFFQSENLNGFDKSLRFKRPFRGQLVELIGVKSTYEDRGGGLNHQVVLNSPNNYLRVVWDELDGLISKYGMIV